MKGKLWLIVLYAGLAFLLYQFIAKTDRFMEAQTTNVIGTIIWAALTFVITYYVFKKKR